MLHLKKSVGPLLVALAIGAWAFSGSTAQAVTAGDPAPAFSATDAQGKQVSLTDFSGKFVVLEWHNQGCPYVKKHYESGNMQRLQKKWTEKGVAWLTVISSAKGKQGAVSGAQAMAYVKKTHAHPTAVLMDTDQKVAHLYEAKTTPHMIVISDKGTIVYDGAIDNKESTDKRDVASATNYVDQALTEAMVDKKAVTVSSTRPYGCAVKYAD